MTSTPSTPLRCGAVGVGRMGRHHARVYAQMEGIDLVGVVDANLDRAKEIDGIFAFRRSGLKRNCLDDP